jgi:GTPase SAR1 family protein
MGCNESKNKNPPTPLDKSSGYDYRIQFLLVGPESVGKTAIMSRFVENKFSSESENIKILQYFS